MKKNKGNEDYNFWQPATDMMTGLVFILLLVIVLLGLRLLYAPDLKEQKITETETGGYGTTESETEPYWHRESELGNGLHYESETTRNESFAGGAGAAGGAAGGGTGETTPQSESESEPESEGDGDKPDDGLKSAVRVQIVDADTGHAIKKAGVKFELYREHGGLQILNTYYPEKITYRDFETTEDGSFYLPEKILEGGYYFRALSTASGYENAEDAHFTIKKLYDWGDPYQVRIGLSPSRNVITVHVVDSDTGKALEGVQVNITAAENITTLDDTVRFTEGQTADNLTTDENGDATSRELYLGTYSVGLEETPEYYASPTSLVKAEVKKSGAAADSSSGKTSGGKKVSLKLAKTSLKLSLADELYPGTGIEGAEFTLTGEDGKERSIRTDEGGQAQITDLQHNGTYHIRQAKTAENFRMDTSDHVITVGDDGRIDGKETGELKLTNRMIRVSIGVTDRILRKQMDGSNLSLYQDDGTRVAAWTTEAREREFDGLEPGKYYILVNDDPDKRTDIQIADTAKSQSFSVSVMTMQSYLVIAAAVAGALIVILLLILIIRRMSAGRKNKKE